ncbi:transglycosylase [Actinorhabdospora filicis]|uniref:Transglycosylase n=1 Tax=Actinorhabdospora filicis TaxID=1785913 RepID=A0A9W6SSE6_9ACTN|nr:GlsB/YeaQ/YmgE family stress response membrane protein [Actinorhabdospora filicis]GLZ81586.1 transglycosylase [Actinorhabdospora filicis]
MTIDGIFSALIIGLVVGALGRLILPGRQNIPIWLTLVVGVVAAFLGTALAKLFGVATTKGVDWIELFFQLALAVVGVAIVAAMRKKT